MRTELTLCLQTILQEFNMISSAKKKEETQVHSFFADFFFAAFFRFTDFNFVDYKKRSGSFLE